MGKLGKTIVCGCACGWLVAGCGTLGGTQWPRADAMEQAFTKVQAAEAEPMAVDTRAFELRVQARREYTEAQAAMRDSRADRARHLYDCAAVDADLSLALARQDTWHQQTTERSAMLQDLEGQPGGVR